MYFNKIYPIEDATSFSRFENTAMHEGDFESPPLVLLLGPYSAGKVNISFFRYKG